MALIKSISGIRGTIGNSPNINLTPLDIVRFTSAYAMWVKGKTEGRLTVVTGRDARISGPMVHSLVNNTLVGMGIDVIDLGLSTTPTVAISVPMENADGGIIITASHNPKKWNALKLLNETGEFIDSNAGSKIIDLAEAEKFSYAEIDNLGTISENSNYLDKHINATVSLKYVPKVASGSAFSDSNPTAARGSAIAYGFEGGFGVDGLKVLVSINEVDQNGNSATQIEQTMFGASYNFGNITVGVQETTYDNTTTNSMTYSEGNETEALSYGATIAVNDQVSLGIQYAELSGDGITSDEEITSVSAGYNLGGATIGLQYHDAENVDGTTGNDGEAIELRIKQKF